MLISNANTRGILAMNAAMFSFIVNDSFVKALSTTLPLSQIVTLRGLVAALLVLVVCWARGAFASWRHLFDPMIYLRVLSEIFATVFYLIGFIHLPISNAISIFQATPLAVTAGAALFLGERVGWRRWSAIIIGFIGVLVIVRPGVEGFDAASLLMLASVGFVVARDLATARMPARIPADLATAVTAVVMCLVGVALHPFDGAISNASSWQPLGLAEIAMILAAGLLLLGGYIFLIIAMRSGESSAVAPFRYTLLLWSFLIGMIFFGERPDALTYLGAAIIVATGLYAFHRERLRVADAART